MEIQKWMQDSYVKGLRLQEFEVEESGSLLWIEEDGKRGFRYWKKELEDYNWVLVETENVSRET